MEAVSATLCKVPRCDQVAEIVVRDQDGDEADVCRDHWHEMLSADDGTIRGVRLLRPPSCFQPTCQDFAVTIVANPYGPPRPVCQRHWDDLSWVDVPQDLLTDAPGWSRS